MVLQGILYLILSDLGSTFCRSQVLEIPICRPVRPIDPPVYAGRVWGYMGAYLGKGTYWQFFHKLDSRETSLSNAANHLKIFLIEFEICLYEHLYFLYIRNPLFPIVAFISMFWQLKVNMFYPKNSFPIV